MGRKLRTVVCGEGNVRQLIRFPHFVETASDLRQLHLKRIFVQKVIGDGDVVDFLHSCRTQEPAVALQELLHAVRVGKVPLVEEEIRSGGPAPFHIWIIDVEE